MSPGELVRLNRSETLLFKGENYKPAPKSQEYTVLKYDPAQKLVYVPYFKEDGSAVAVTVPVEAVETVARDGWGELLRAFEAFREQRFDEVPRALTAAAQDPALKALASALQPRFTGFLNAAGVALGGRAQAFGNLLAGMRETAVQLDKAGHASLALALEEGLDKVSARVQAANPGGTPALAGSKVDREPLRERAVVGTLGVNLGRQAAALHRMLEAKRWVEAGLKAEPSRPDLKALMARVEKDLGDAEDDFKAANSMRKHAGGAVHALSALDHGLKKCADHPKLKELKKEMESAFEERTSPPVTPALVAASGGSSAAVLEEARKLYTARCTECHDLELLDSRSMDGWSRAMASMGGRAHLSDGQRGKILEYLAAAQRTLNK
jgi:cytochrome c5